MKSHPFHDDPRAYHLFVQLLLLLPESGQGRINRHSSSRSFGIWRQQNMHAKVRYNTAAIIRRSLMLIGSVALPLLARSFIIIY